MVNLMFPLCDILPTDACLAYATPICFVFVRMRQTFVFFLILDVVIILGLRRKINF